MVKKWSKGLGKTINTGCIVLLVVSGVIIAAIDPIKAEGFREVALGLSPILLAHMAAIWGGDLNKVLRMKWGNSTEKPDDGMI